MPTSPEALRAQYQRLLQIYNGNIPHAELLRLEAETLSALPEAQERIAGKLPTVGDRRPTGGLRAGKDLGNYSGERGHSLHQESGPELTIGRQNDPGHTSTIYERTPGIAKRKYNGPAPMQWGAIAAPSGRGAASTFQPGEDIEEEEYPYIDFSPFFPPEFPTSPPRPSNPPGPSGTSPMPPRPLPPAPAPAAGASLVNPVVPPPPPRPSPAEMEEAKYLLNQVHGKNNEGRGGIAQEIKNRYNVDPNSNENNVRPYMQNDGIRVGAKANRQKEDFIEQLENMIPKEPVEQMNQRQKLLLGGDTHARVMAAQQALNQEQEIDQNKYPMLSNIDDYTQFTS